MLKIKFSSIVLILFFIASCSSSKTTAPITVSKGLCKGLCPQYNVTIHDNGELNFEGLKNTAFIGKTNKNLTKEEKNKLINAFKKMNISEIASPQNHLYDYPETTIVYNNKKVVFQKPEAVSKHTETFMLLLDNTLKKYNLIH